MSKNEYDFITEQIVPRKKTKKILTFIFSAIGLGILFGAVAGVTFSASRKLLDDSKETVSELIVIARDETSADTKFSETRATRTPTKEPNTIKETEATESYRETEQRTETKAKFETKTKETAKTEETEESSKDLKETIEPGSEKNSEEEETEAGGDLKDPGEETESKEAETETEPEESIKETEKTEKETEPEETVKETEETEKETKISEEDTSLKTVYRNVKDAFVKVNVKNSTTGGIFDTTVTEKTECFGVCILETTDRLFILTEYDKIKDSKSLTVTVNGQTVNATLQEKDDIIGFCILKVMKNTLHKTPTVLKLGNSYLLDTGSRVFMAGEPLLIGNTWEEGYITLNYDKEDTVDGYTQVVYTNMQRIEGGTAVLLNEDGALIGWISDKTCRTDTNTAIAMGISNVKYILEDMCSGINTAYLGIYGINCTEEEDSVPDGYYITSVESGSPAYKAGLQTGDRIVAIDGYSIGNAAALMRCIDRLSSGKEVKITVIRRSFGKDVTVELLITPDRR